MEEKQQHNPQRKGRKTTLIQISLNLLTEEKKPRECNRVPSAIAMTATSPAPSAQSQKEMPISDNIEVMRLLSSMPGETTEGWPLKLFLEAHRYH